MFCVDASRTGSVRLRVEIKGAGECAGKAAAGARGTLSTSDPDPSTAGRVGRAGDGQQVVYDVFSLGRAACTLLNPGQPWHPSSCDSVADASQWVLRNVTTDVKSVQPLGDPQVVRSWKPLGNFQQFNNTNERGLLDYTLTWTQGQMKSTATQFGWKLGQKISIKKTVSFLVGGEVSGEFSAEQNWSDTTTTTTSDQKTEAISSSIATQPKGTTYLYGFQSQGNLGFNYNADVTAGVANTAQPIKTPMTRPLGMSAARNHPCIGYLAGSADPGSLIGLGRLAASRGISPDSVDLTDDQRTFLRSVPGFKVSDGDRCPGFPGGYPAQMSFKGTASISGSAGGPAKVSWDPKLGEVKTCAFFKPAGGPPSGAKRAAAGPDPCTEGPSAPPPSSAGTVFDGADFGPGATIHGDGGTNLLLANGTRDLGAARYLGEGGNDIFQGRRFADRFIGGPGADILNGAGGGDVLRGDAGPDTLAGGAGDDDLADNDGSNALFGGVGDDRLRTTAGARGGLLGQAGDDVLAMRGHGNVAMQGGAGDDTYRLVDGARANNITETANQGSDRILTDHSLTVPVNVERARAVGNKPVELRSGIGDTTLIGGPADDSLDAGPGSARLDGRGGDDEIRLNAFGFDRASGGPGADDFVDLNKRPPDASFPVGLRHSDTSSHLITGFSVSQGDRIVLPVGRFGSRLATVREDGTRITEGAHPRGTRPQLVFNPKTQLLEFDPDGNRGTPATVIATLRGLRHLPGRAISIVGGKGRAG